MNTKHRVTENNLDVIEGAFESFKRMSQCVYQTIKRFLQLDPVLVDKVTVIFSVPKASVSL